MVHSYFRLHFRWNYPGPSNRLHPLIYRNVLLAPVSILSVQNLKVFLMIITSQVIIIAERTTRLPETGAHRILFQLISATFQFSIVLKGSFWRGNFREYHHIFSKFKSLCPIIEKLQNKNLFTFFAVIKLIIEVKKIILQ